MRRDYYAVLGIAASADAREIRRAYRRLARQYSPDVNFWDAQARAIFDEIAEAYRVLSDPGARSLYDRFGAAMRERGAPPTARRGDDLHLPLALSFLDAARGVSLTLGVPRLSPCPYCQAAGCPECGGRGVRSAVDPVALTVPAGVDTGAQIRVVGEGHAGPLGAPRGDLVVSTRVEPHPFFARKGDNLHCEVPISVTEAILGARIAVPTLDGEAALIVPPGTQGGQVFRLRGRGLPRLAGGAGDLYVTVRVEVPRGLDARTQELVRELDRVIAANPRAGLARNREGQP
jgi:molecular chaperone DnaJ